MKCNVLAIMSLFMLVQTASGQNLRLLTESQRTRERVNEAIALENEQKYTQALDHYLKIVNDVPDEWLPVADGRTFRPVRQVVLGRIAANPSLRAFYRDRFELTAAAIYRRGVEKKDILELERVVSLHWPTVSAAKSLDMLGDLAFERGELAAAISWWRLLAGPNRAGEPIFPDPTADKQMARLKSIVAAMMLGETVTAQIDGFRLDFPAARGTLAGRDEPLAEWLTALAKNPGARLQQEDSESLRMLGANPARTGTIRPKILHHVPNQLLRPIEWPGGEPTQNIQLPDRNPIASPRQLLTHPLVWSGKLIVGDGQRIFALHLDSGLIADVFGPREQTNTQPLGPQTLCVAGDRVYARLNQTTLVALERDRLAAQWAWKKVWEVKSSIYSPNVEFEACPVATAERLYVSWSENSPNRSTINVACYSLRELGDVPMWITPIAELQFDPDVKRARSPLLTVAGGNVIYGTDAGVIVALNGLSGKPAWAATYESRGQRGLPANLLPVPRDVCPPVYAHGRVFVAPYDTEEIIALDAHTGGRLWDRPRVVEVVQLLGVIGNKLIFSADGVYRGIGAVEVATGQVDRQWGDLTAAAPFGRGLILGDCVLFPTRDHGLAILNHDGRPVYAPALFQSLPGGNLSFGDGTLIIATGEHLLRTSARAIEHGERAP